MKMKTKDKAFRDLHEALTEWTCQYCKEAATTIRHDTAVCSQHRHPWAIGIEVAALQASRSH